MREPQDQVLLSIFVFWFFLLCWLAGGAVRAWWDERRDDTAGDERP